MFESIPFCRLAVEVGAGPDPLEPNGFERRPELVVAVAHERLDGEALCAGEAKRFGQEAFASGRVAAKLGDVHGAVAHVDLYVMQPFVRV